MFPAVCKFLQKKVDSQALHPNILYEVLNMLLCWINLGTNSHALHWAGGLLFRSHLEIICSLNISMLDCTELHTWPASIWRYCIFNQVTESVLMFCKPPWICHHNDLKQCLRTWVQRLSPAPQGSEHHTSSIRLVIQYSTICNAVANPRSLSAFLRNSCNDVSYPIGIES